MSEKNYMKHYIWLAVQESDSLLETDGRSVRF